MVRAVLSCTCTMAGMVLAETFRKKREWAKTAVIEDKEDGIREKEVVLKKKIPELKAKVIQVREQMAHMKERDRTGRIGIA